MNAFRNISRPTNVVAPSGPPPVKTSICSEDKNAPIKAKIILIMIKGLIIGIVIFFNLLKNPHPSIAAASYKSLGTVFNAANEIAVESFINGEIKFNEIYEVIYRTFTIDHVSNDLSLESIHDIDTQTRIEAKKVVKSIN